jgi:sirohydrochlorin ferrochelatase
MVTREVRDVATASHIHLSWPGRGKAWRRAAETLADALRGEATPEKARAAFVEAAREAEALVERDEAADDAEYQALLDAMNGLETTKPPRR